jgi:hypothetical protein
MNRPYGTQLDRRTMTPQDPFLSRLGNPHDMGSDSHGQSLFDLPLAMTEQMVVINVDIRWRLSAKAY